MEDYLGMSYEGPDREFLHGEILERSVGNKQHSRVQGRLCILFGTLSGSVGPKRPLFVSPEIRVRTAEDRYRVIDLALYVDDDAQESVPSSPPLAAIEILSPDDRMADTIEKLDEYRAWGVAYVWLINPESRRIYRSTSAGLEETNELSVPDLGVCFSSEAVFADVR